MVYFILLLFIAMFASVILKGNSSNTDDYFSNYQKTGTFTVVLSLLASLIGGWMFFGLTQIGYEAGIAGIAVGLGYSIGLAFFALKADVIYRISSETHSHNLLDVIKFVFGGRVYIVVVLINLLFFLGVIGAQFIALKTLFYSISGIGNEWMFWALALLVIVYSSIGGFRGVLITDKYQFFGIGLLIIAISIIFAPSLASISSLPETHIQGTGYGVAFLVASLVIFPFTIFCRADLWQRASSSSSQKVLKYAILYTIPILLIIYVIFTLFGMVAATHNIEPIQLLVTMLSSILGNNIGSSLFILGVGSALISTIDTNTNVLTRIVYSAIIPKNSLGVAIPRITSLIIGIIALFLALSVANIVSIIISAGAIILVMFPTVASLLKPNIISNAEKYEAASFWSIIIGSVALISTALMVDIKAAFIVGFLCSYIAWFSVLYFKKITSK